LWVRAGGYTVDPSSLPEGIQVEPSAFPLVRGESVELRVRFVTSKPVAPAIEVVTLDNAKRLQHEWAKYLKRDVVETIVLDAKQNVLLKMVLIPPGEFMMGSTPDFVKKHAAEGAKFFDKRALMGDYAKNLAAETPAHTVRITKPFYMGMHEVTYGQFSKFVAAMSYITEAEKSKVGGTSVELKALELLKGLNLNKALLRKPEFKWNMTGFKQTPEHPVGNVTWADADAFCEWLSKKDHKRFGLPTEAEWEYACRAGSTQLWHFGDDAKIAAASMTHFQMGFNPKKGLAFDGPHAVGEKPANQFGLFDMHGNVEEMCADLWSKDYYAKSPQDDPRGPLSNPGQGRVTRGGSFLETPFAARSAYRNAVNPTLAHIHVGFRVVCEVPLPAE
jgi:formylglycine-generating enzyme required for sulfatase activity